MMHGQTKIMFVYVYTVHNTETLVGQGKYEYKNWDSNECRVPEVRQPWSRAPPSTLLQTLTDTRLIRDFLDIARSESWPIGTLQYF